MLVPKSMKLSVTWNELTDYFKRELVSAVSETPWRAVSACIFTSYCAFAEFAEQDSSARLLQIPLSFLIHVEHCEKNVQAQEVAYPYQGNLGSKIILGEPTRAQAERWI